jgi:hypothetical protein
LGVGYIIYYTKKVLKTGDIVILPLELRQFAYNGIPTQLKASFLLSYDRDYLCTLPLQWQLQSTRQFDLWMLRKSLKLQRLYERYKPKESPFGMGYNSETLNENGDETFNEGNEKISKIFETLKPFRLPRGRFVETYALKKIVRFSEWCQERKIRFYISYSNALYFKEYEDKEYC